MTPTPEQVAIVEAAKNTKDNLIIHALAGAAKTSTLVLIAKALPAIPMICLAFNVRIKDELKDRLPGNCEALTLNSIGHRTWQKAIGKRCIVEKDKTYKIVKKIIDDLPEGDRLAGYEQMSDIMQAINSAKNQGWIPDGKFQQAKRLLDNAEFFGSLDDEPSPLFEWICCEAMFQSIAQSLQGTIDYADQLFMPTLFHGTFPNSPLYLLDESQDFSELNHAMLGKMARQRIIAVGDENQSIYGFRGAHPDSMSLMQHTFEMVPFQLSISFRCPRRVVLEARTRAPMMQWPEWAIEGTVSAPAEWDISILPQTCTIICRNNAPIFGMAIRLIRNGRFPEIVGNDIGKKLIKIMQKLGDDDTKEDEAYRLVDEWVDAKLKKSRNESSVYDQAECMKVFIEAGKTLGGAVAYAQSLMDRSGTIKMMTIHKAKGLEWPDVFILDRQIIQTERSLQEKNLLYVAQTRAQRNLTYITSDGFKGI